jgi:predicted ATPase
VDWSCELLTDEEKACFAKLAVFVGGATVEAAEAICAADLDTLDQLIPGPSGLRCSPHPPMSDSR